MFIFFYFFVCPTSRQNIDFIFVSHVAKVKNIKTWSKGQSQKESECLEFSI